VKTAEQKAAAKAKKERRAKHAAHQAKHQAKKKAAADAQAAAIVRAKADLEIARPRLTKALAEEFVKLLNAGLPQLEALGYFSPAYSSFSKEQREAWMAEWAADPLMIAAVSAANRGDWPDLSEDQRVEVSLALATNQMAHFLYTRSYHEVMGADFDKWVDARKALQARVDARTGTGESAYEKFLKSLLSQSAAAGPPQLQLVKK